MSIRELHSLLADLAARNVYIGTSSWKYPGWCGQLYEDERYFYRGKFSETRFNRNCLEEYAQVFKTVCVDAGYYRFPEQRYLEALASQVPDDFLFSFKVTDQITIKKFTRLPRFGDKAGKPNEHFLDADLFERAFLRPCEFIRGNVGLLIFEFSRFYPADFTHGREFAELLDAFLEKLPPDWQYGVEIRNRSFLHPDYFEVLKKHGVAHVYNNWDRMPSVAEQMKIPDTRTQPAYTGARFLLKPGRKYQDAVDLFSPYEEAKETDDEARQAGADLINSIIGGKKGEAKPSFIYINNRLEGNALITIEAMLARAGLI